MGLRLGHETLSLKGLSGDFRTMKKNVRGRRVSAEKTVSAVDNIVYFPWWIFQGKIDFIFSSEDSLARALVMQARFAVSYRHHEWGQACASAKEEMIWLLWNGRYCFDSRENILQTWPTNWFFDDLLNPFRQHCSWRASWENKTQEYSASLSKTNNVQFW